MAKKIRTGDKKHIGEGNLHIHLLWRGPIDSGGFIEIFGNVHQKTCTDQHGIGNANPCVDKKDDDFWKKGVESCVREPLDRRGSPADILQERIDDAKVRFREHEGDKHQGDELRDGNRRDEDGSPEFLELDALRIDDHGDNHADEIVREGGKEGPDERPEKNLSEDSQEGGSGGCPGRGEDLGEIVESDPVEELCRCDMKIVVVGKGNQYHHDDRNDGEYGKSADRDEKKRLVVGFVQDILKRLLVGGEFSNRLPFLKGERIS